MRALATLLGLCLAVPASADWHVARSDQFVVYSGGKAAYAVEQVVKLERFDRIMRGFAKVPKDKTTLPLRIYLTDNVSDLRRVGNMDREVAGFYTARVDGICAFAPRRVRMGEDEILFHEYAHHFMMQHFPAAYPAWFIEGFAEYFMNTRVEEFSAEVGDLHKWRARWLLVQWPKLETIVDGSASGHDLFYPLSWFLTHYLYSDRSQTEKLSAYLNAVGDGHDNVAAFEEHIGDFRSVEMALRKYQQSGKISYLRFKFSEPLEAGAEITFEKLPDWYDDAFLPFSGLSCGLEGKKNLEDLRKAAKRRSENTELQVLLAKGEALAGSTDAAISTLLPASQSEAADADIFYHLGRAYSRRAHEDEHDQDENHALARAEYARAYALRPDHFPTQYFYAMDGQYLSDETDKNLVWMAHQSAPQVADLRLAAVNVLISDGELQQAAATLAPLLFDPHAQIPPEIVTLYQRLKANDPSLIGERTADQGHIGDEDEE